MYFPGILRRRHLPALVGFSEDKIPILMSQDFRLSMVMYVEILVPISPRLVTVIIDTEPSKQLLIFLST